VLNFCQSAHRLKIVRRQSSSKSEFPFSWIMDSMQVYPKARRVLAKIDVYAAEGADGTIQGFFNEIGLPSLSMVKLTWRGQWSRLSEKCSEAQPDENRLKPVLAGE
jgi:hypothetical protein